MVGVGRRERRGDSRVEGGFGAPRANSTVCLRVSPPEAVTERFDLPEDRQDPLQTTRRAAASACGLRRWLAVVVVLIAVGSAGGTLACAPATAAGLGQTGPVWSARSPQAATSPAGTDDRSVGTLSSVALALTVTGSGDVTSAPTDISCGASAVQCAATYDSSAATSVTLTATPQPGEVFLGWYGDTCTGAASTCVVTMSAAKSITASFTGRSSYALAVAVSGSGVVTGAPTTIDCNEAGTPVCAQALLAGSTVTLTAEPSAGSAFAGWGGACAGSGSTCTVTVIACTISCTGTLVNVDTYRPRSPCTASLAPQSRPLSTACFTATSARCRRPRRRRRRHRRRRRFERRDLASGRAARASRANAGFWLSSTRPRCAWRAASNP